MLPLPPLWRLGHAVLPTGKARGSERATTGEWLLAWRQAVGPRPHLKPYARLRGPDKWRLLHRLAVAAQGDDDDYFTAYTLTDIDDVVAQRLWSVEHVRPQSKCHDAQAGADPNGWIEATRRANQRRSNHPLVLWLDGDDAGDSFTVLQGVMHYRPPASERARLARKWLYMGATHARGCDPPSRAQRAHMREIIHLVRSTPVSAVERRVAEAVKEAVGFGNPLILDADPGRFYDDDEWVRAVFGDATQE